MFLQQKSLEESIGDPGEVGTWWIKVRSAEDMPRVVAAINRAFENTSAEVRAESERAFQLSFISMMGNIKLVIGLISTAGVFALMLVSASTMSMAIREGFRELAGLKGVGFRPAACFCFIYGGDFG